MEGWSEEGGNFDHSDRMAEEREREGNGSNEARRVV